MEQLESYRRAFADHSFFIALDGSKHYYIHNSASLADRVEITTLAPDNASDRWYFEAMRTVEKFALNVDYDRLIRAAKVWINAVIRELEGKGDFPVYAGEDPVLLQQRLGDGKPAGKRGVQAARAQEKSDHGEKTDGQVSERDRQDECGAQPGRSWFARQGRALCHRLTIRRTRWTCQRRRRARPADRETTRGYAFSHA